MTFQSSVFEDMGFGVPGEYFTNSPWKAQPFTIRSAVETNNLIGSTCCTVTAQGICAAGAPAQNFGFAGFLVNPKGQALMGVGSDPLAPTLTVRNEQIVECLTMGTIVVQLPAPANIGDYVVFDNITGQISAISTIPFNLTGITTVGSPVITMGFTTGVNVGDAVSGAGIPDGSVVISVIDNNSVTISEDATEAGTAPFSFTPSGTVLPAGKTFANAMVDYFMVDAAGSQLAVLSVNPTYVIPTSA